MKRSGRRSLRDLGRREREVDCDSRRFAWVWKRFMWLAALFVAAGAIMAPLNPSRVDHSVAILEAWVRHSTVDGKLVGEEWDGLLRLGYRPDEFGDWYRRQLMSSPGDAEGSPTWRESYLLFSFGFFFREPGPSWRSFGMLGHVWAWPSEDGG